MLDPTWQSPYSPSSEEREAHRTAVRTAVWGKRRAPLAAVGVVALVLVIVAAITLGYGVAAAAFVVGVVIVAGGVAMTEVQCRRMESASPLVASRLLSSFTPGGTTKDAQRLATVVDRLSATFGVSDVRPLVVQDEGFNAAFVASAYGFDLLVTSSLMHEFELIELEGVVAHLMARQRLGSLERLAAACVAGGSSSDRAQLAGPGTAYRADEVAAAAIRYPNGLAQALGRCAHHHVSSASYFASSAYVSTRWVWFDQFADRPTDITMDIDSATVRARALNEW